MGVEMKIEQAVTIAENDHGVSFGVGYFGGRWIGYARGTSHEADTGEPMEFLFLLADVADGSGLPGCETQGRAFALTIRELSDPSSAWGRIEWFIDEDLVREITERIFRGNPPCFLGGRDDDEERTSDEETEGGDEAAGEESDAGGEAGDEESDAGGEAGDEESDDADQRGEE